MKTLEGFGEKTENPRTHQDYIKEETLPVQLFVTLSTFQST